jgi:biotin carboxylase
MSALTILCLASYEKGHEFLREAKRKGARVLLLTSQSLKDKAHWPVECIDEIFYMPDEKKRWNRTDTIHAVSYLARTQAIDRLVPLDDFDLEMAAALREHLRIPGMGETTTRYFRDKLAMRMQAQEKGLNVPDFIHVLNHRRVQEFLDRIPAPWVLKPRLSAGAIGIKLVHSQSEFWQVVDQLGDEQSYYLVERYVPGEVYHADTIVYEREILFAIASRYGHPPLDVSHKGGIFTTRILERGSEEEQSILAKNRMVMEAMGLVRGVSHTEFIRSRQDGKVYFLETSARVGGAHIAELVEAATGLNLWAEWAKVELAGGKQPYSVVPLREEYAGLLVSLAKQEHPDTAAYDDPEVVWRMSKQHHVGMILRSPSYRRVQDLLSSYALRVRDDFMTSAPPPERPTD